MTGHSVEQAIRAVREGRMVVLADDEARESEGVLALAAERVTPEAVNFMAREARGIVCVALPGERLEALRIPVMVPDQPASGDITYCVSVDAKAGTTTGISAFDRAVTIQTLVDPKARPEDLGRPGHIFPLRTKEGGVLTRAGQAEAALDLCRLAGLYPGAVLCAILTEEGTAARLSDLQSFAERHHLASLTVKTLIDFRMRREKLVKRIATTPLPTHYGTFQSILYESQVDGRHHLAMILGEVSTADDVLVRVSRSVSSVTPLGLSTATVGRDFGPHSSSSDRRARVFWCISGRRQVGWNGPATLLPPESRGLLRLLGVVWASGSTVLGRRSWLTWV